MWTRYGWNAHQDYAVPDYEPLRQILEPEYDDDSKGSYLLKPKGYKRNIRQQQRIANDLEDIKRQMNLTYAHDDEGT